MRCVWLITLIYIFRIGYSNSLFNKKFYACASTAYLTGINSWYVDSRYLQHYTDNTLGPNLEHAFSLFSSSYTWMWQWNSMALTAWTDRVTAPCKDKFYPRHHNQGSWCAFPLWSDESGFAYNRHKSQRGRWIGCQALELTNDAVNTAKHGEYNTLPLALFVKILCVWQYSRVSPDIHNKYRFS